MLPIYIVSRAHPDRMHTAMRLKKRDIPFTLVVDDNEQVKQAARLGYRRALSTETTDLVSKRNAITDLVGRGWYIGMDDNIFDFNMVAKEFRVYDRVDTSNPEERPWRKLWNQPVLAEDYIMGLENLAKRAGEVGAEYAGVATMENPFFRMKRWGYRRFVKSKVFVMRHGSKIRFKHRLCHDSYASAHAVALHGRVLTDSFMFYTARWYEKGGLGTREEREKAGLLDQLQECIDEFPGLVGMARGHNSALKFLLRSDESVNRWRREHGWLD